MKKGWLDEYENGGEYLGTTNVGRNYSPAWGGQFQMGGYVYPTTFVPHAQKGEKVRFIEPPPIDYELQYSGDPSKKYPVSSDVMKQIVATSVGMGYDPKRALAVALQESGIGRTDPNYFHVLRGKTKSGKDRIPEEYQNLTMDELGIQLLKDKQKLANKLGYTTPEMELQTYNGLGKIFRDTEKDYHGFEMQKIYGVPIPEEGIDLRKNPLYGKRIMDLEKEVVSKDPYVNQLVDYYNKFYSNPDSVYYTKASNLEPIEVVAPSKAKKQKTENSVVKEGFLKLVDDLKNGGSVPGSIGFTYARTQDIPSEGPYAKKTLPSAQTGYSSKPFEMVWKENAPSKKSTNNVERYEPSNAVKNAKSTLAVASLAGSSNPVTQYLAQIAGGTGDLYTSARYAMDKNWGKAGEDFVQGALGFIPYSKAIQGMKGDYFTKGAQFFNKWLKRAHAASDVKTLSESPKNTKLPRHENGGSMSFYQHGLDWTPRNISKNGSVVKDNMGYWNPDNWGKVVEIDSPNITMKGVNQPLLGISDEGDVQYMEPGKDYKFKGKKVKEYPVAKNGVNQQDEKTVQHLDQLLNFTNYNKPKAKSGGWLDKY
jgi:hypothetical protein